MVSASRLRIRRRRKARAFERLDTPGSAGIVVGDSRRLAAGDDRVEVPPAVLRYIREHGLYRRQIYAITSISTSELPGMPPAAAMVVRTGGLPRSGLENLVHGRVIFQIVQVHVALQNLVHRRAGIFELRLNFVQHVLGVRP